VHDKSILKRKIGLMIERENFMHLLTMTKPKIQENDFHINNFT